MSDKEKEKKEGGEVSDYNLSVPAQKPSITMLKGGLFCVSIPLNYVPVEVALGTLSMATSKLYTYFNNIELLRMKQKKEKTEGMFQKGKAAIDKILKK